MKHSAPQVSRRRRFIRVLGVGSLAAALPLSGCSWVAGMPASAIAAWQGPDKQDDPRLWALAWAILAPNPHNRQPWLARLHGQDELELMIDTGRLLPHTDPFSRQIMIGTGAMLGLLEIAAAQRGRRLEIEEFPEGMDEAALDSRPVARIRFVATDRADAHTRELFAQVPHRHTYRGLYRAADRLDPAFIADLQREQAALQPHGLASGVFERGRDAGRFGEIDAIARAAWRIELSTPATMLESMQLLRIGATEIDRHRDGISLTDPFVVTLDALGLVDRDTAPAPDSSLIKRQITDFDSALDSTPAIYWLTSDGHGRRDQLAVGRAYLRAQLAATARGLVMHPLSQALQEYAEVAGPYKAIHESLRGAIGRPEATVQMLCRIGAPAADAKAPSPSPRRGLAAHLVDERVPGMRGQQRANASPPARSDRA
ncbi:MAG: twin-arginine translocation pathway signal protein [Burkholderiaceae bacterium]